MQQHNSLNVCSSLSQLETRLKGKDLSSTGISPGSHQPQFKPKRLMKRQSSAPIRFQAMNKVAEPRYNVINNHLSHAKGVQTLALVRGNSSCSLIDVETYILSLGSVERNDTESVDSQEKKNYYPRSRPIIDLRQNSRKTRMKENHGNGLSSKCTCTFFSLMILAAVMILIIIGLLGIYLVTGIVS